MVLDRFSPATRAWFDGAFDAPTPAQLGAWEAVSSGSHALVVAPTGSGKTLAAFLWSIDQLITTPGEGTRVLYISPLKALGVDVERNLRAPLVGVTQTAKRLEMDAPAISVGVRSGDTTPADRRTLAKTPPDILITTPESLYLMLTSAARESLKNVQTVIIDEVHAVAATKRGAHLAVSLERLDALLPKPAQRIGLSATVRPLAEVARFLGGRSPVTIVQPPAAKTFDLTVVVPVEDMTEPGMVVAREGASAPTGMPAEGTGSIWPHVEESIVDQILAHRSTIVFANSRRLAERLTARLNEIYEERLELANAPGEMVAATSRNKTAAPPAAMMAQAGATAGAAPLLARAHHGSVSKEQRATIEDDLKTGVLRCVVATSSLELGIDMGAVDLVIQVESPPSVASGLQRIGRAGHQVGEISKGVLFPKHRTDLIHTTVAVERMLSGEIEAIAVPANPLDVLAQQTVAATALEGIDVEEWFDTVRRSAPFATLPRSAYDATLDLLSGLYPSDEFAELRPRIVWDRVAGTITGRPGAQRLAVTSGGTIPDRGLFGVFMVGGATDGKGPGRRVGELDEEMVYESRVGDVFALGTTSWRIEEITHDQVLVSPAFGQPGKVPFWKGDGLGRPAELGEAVGALARELASGTPRLDKPDDPTRLRLEKIGLDELATRNLTALIAEQKASTGQVPSDTTLVVERFRDELGDWRVVLHSPYGIPVNAPWALAVTARIRDRLGVDGAAMAGDDGIVVRIPDTDAEPPGAELFAFEADELREIVTEEVGGSALFAARFRECAARALLLPRRDPGRRSPLWQQRQRASQLLEVARKYPSFPIVLETVREVLQDVYDLPSLMTLTARLSGRQVRMVEVETEVPSPFARSLLFGYVAAFMYEGDSPLAERRAAALSLDPSLLAELLGRAELRELLDPGVIELTERELQRLTPERRAKDAEGVVDLVRMLGPLTEEELLERTVLGDASTGSAGFDKLSPLGSSSAGFDKLNPLGSSSAGFDKLNPLGSSSAAFDTLNPPSSGSSLSRSTEPAEVREPSDVADLHAVPLATLTTWLTDLARANRVLKVTIAGTPHWAAVEDAARLRDALGVPLPIGIPVAFIEPVPDPLGDLVSRYARVHGPFLAENIAERFGLGIAIVTDALRRLGADRRVIDGEFRPGATGTEWCSVEVLRRLRSRSLAALRHEVEPVEQTALARFLPQWQHLVDAGGSHTLRGVDGLAQVIDQLTGVALPASTWESLVFPARLRDYSQAWLDELTVSGEIVWAGGGSLPGGDGWVSFHPAASAPLTLPAPTGDETTELQRDILAVLAGGGAYFFRQLSTALGSTDDTALIEALWQLVWSGLITNDTLAPLRAHLGGPLKPSRAPRTRSYRGSRSLAVAQSGPPTGAGRWSLLPLAEADNTVRAKATAELLLERHGVVTRGAVVSEGIRGGFSLAYRVLSGFEESGRARRGYFVDGLGAAQFATGATIDRLRGFTLDPEEEPPLVAVTLSATDPANPYGAALPWPREAAVEGEPPVKHHRPGRKAGALVVMVDGALTLYLERGGKTVLTFGSGEPALAVAAASLARTARGSRRLLRIERVDGEFSVGTALGNALVDAGFAATPQGLRLRG